MHVAHSCALVTMALLFLPAGLLVPQGDVPADSRGCVTTSDLIGQLQVAGRVHRPGGKADSRQAHPGDSRALQGSP